MEIVIQEHACGGKGAIRLEKLHTPEEMRGKCALYARVTMPPGASVGYHTHVCDSESYFILTFGISICILLNHKCCYI